MQNMFLKQWWAVMVEEPFTTQEGLLNVVSEAKVNGFLCPSNFKISCGKEPWEFTEIIYEKMGKTALRVDFTNKMG